MTEMIEAPRLELSHMPDIMIPGRGSVPHPELEGRRATAPMARLRVDTCAAVLEVNQDLLGSTQREVRVGLLGGWARGAGERRPENPEDLEATLNFDYADQLGLISRYRGYVRFFRQGESYSTITDFAFAWRGWREFGLPRRPGTFYTPDNPLAIIAQIAPPAETEGLSDEQKKNTGHLGRGMDAAHFTGGVAHDAMLPLVAPGEDVPAEGRSEQQIRRQMQLLMTGVMGWRGAVLREKVVFWGLEAKRHLGGLATRS